MIAFSLGIVFLNDVATNELEAVHVIGDDSRLIKGLRIPLGQRLSGWVAVNRQTILNSDAALDLGDVARTTGLRCLPEHAADFSRTVRGCYHSLFDGT